MADGDVATLVSRNTTDNSVTNPIFTQPTNGTTAGINPGTGATDLGKAEDSAHASGDTGIAIWGVRNDAGTAFGADGDYVPLSITSTGALRTDASVTINAEKAEDAAHVSGDTGNFMLAVGS
jgi:hypothetical protein